MNNRRINASYTNTENHNLHEGLLLSAVSVISKGDKVLIITTTKNTHTVPQVEQWVQKWAILSFSLYMWHLQGPDIPLKVASICSSVLPLVSGTKTMVKMTFRMHIEANSQKVPALVRRFCKANRYPGVGGSKRERAREREGGKATENYVKNTQDIPTAAQIQFKFSSLHQNMFSQLHKLSLIWI